MTKNSNQGLRTRLRPNSLILTDWSANVESLGRDRRTIIYEIMVQSLLYDKVLIQDEVFALSERLARWFSKPEDTILLKKAFDAGLLVVLTHPLHAYPTDSLKELALTHPIEARAKYIRQFGTKGQKPFCPKEYQTAFYSGLESGIYGTPRTKRTVGEGSSVDIMDRFKVLLCDVLSKEIYIRWVRSAFRGITRQIGEDFISFVQDPERAIGKLEDCGVKVNVVAGPGDKPIFNRSLAYQIAELYPPSQARALRRLIQTVFAAAFCWRENAVGRYGKPLRELLLEPPSESLEYKEIEARVTVEAHVEVPISLPDLDTNFPEVIQRVRRSKAGRALRQSMRRFGQEADFRSQIDCWKSVAEELSSAIRTPSKRIKVSTTAIKVGYKTMLGAVIKGLYETLKSSHSSTTDLLLGAFTGAVGGIAFDHGLEILRQDLREQRVREDLERAVEFRCNWIRMP